MQTTDETPEADTCKAPRTKKESKQEFNRDFQAINRCDPPRRKIGYSHNTGRLIRSCRLWSANLWPPGITNAPACTDAHRQRAGSGVSACSSEEVQLGGGAGAEPAACHSRTHRPSRLIMRGSTPLTRQRTPSTHRDRADKRRTVRAERAQVLGQSLTSAGNAARF